MLHPAELDELKELREAAETCWSLADLARLRQVQGLGSEDECAALATAYREAAARYRSRCLDHLKSLRSIFDDLP